MATPGSSSRSKTGYVAEATKGTTPATPAIKNMRLTASQIVYTPSRITSNEIRADRMVADQILVKLDAGGNLGFELSFSAIDDMIQGALQGTFTAKPAITVVTSDTEISDITATTATVNTGLGTPFKANMLVFTSGFTTAVNNGVLAPVASSGSTTVVFPSSTFTIEGAAIPVGAKLQVVGFQGASADITATAGGLASTVLDFTTLGLTVGEWIKIGGDATAMHFATANCVGWARVTAIATHALTLDNKPAGWTTDSGTGKTLQIFTGDFMVNGTTTQSFTFERQQQDLTAPVYEYFTGMQVDKLSLPFKASSVLTGTLNYVGMSASETTTRIVGATDVTAPSYSVLNASSHVGQLYENGSPVSSPSYIQEIGLDISNNLSGQFAIGNIAAIGILNGEFNVSGALTAYFGDDVLLKQVISDTDTSMMFKAGRTDGNRESILFDVPSMRVSGTSPVDAKNQSRMFKGTFAAKIHPTLAYMLSVGRFWYLPGAS